MQYQYKYRMTAGLVTLAIWLWVIPAAVYAQSLPVQPPRLITLSAKSEVLMWVENGPRGDQVMVKPLSSPGATKRLLWRADGWIDGMDVVGPNLLVRTRRSGWVRWYQVRLPTGGQRLLLSERVSGRIGPQLLQVLDDQQVLISNDRRRSWQPDLLTLGPSGQSPIDKGGQNIFRWHPAPDGRSVLARRWRFDDKGPLYEWLWRPARETPWAVIRQRRLSEPRWQLSGYSLAENLAIIQPEGDQSPLALNLSNGGLSALDNAHPEQTLAVGSLNSVLKNVNQDLAAEADSYDWSGVDPSLGGRSRRWLGQSGTDAFWQIGPDAAGLKVLRVNQSGVTAVAGIAKDAGAQVTTHQVRTRDDESMEVLLTLPAAPVAHEPQAMVLLIHGGPWSHDEAGWNPEAQWLASLGYSVLQANFRGSTNAGFSWQWAGRRQWSGKMLDDLEDALAWARQRSIAGADRVCTMGSSFGGFAALMLAARDNPQLRCTVARAPVSDIAQQMAYLKSIGNARGFQEWREMVGDPLTHNLAENSPIGIAARIQGPILLGHGQYDDVVQIQQTQRLIARLETLEGVDVQWLKLMGQGHDLRGVTARRQWYSQVAHFLDQARQSGG